MQVFGWAVVALLAAVLLRRRPIYQAGAVATLWVLVPGTAGELITGRSAGILSIRPGTWLAFASVLTLLFTYRALTARAVGSRMLLYTALSVVLAAAVLVTQLGHHKGGMVLVLDQLFAPMLVFLIIHVAALHDPGSLGRLRSLLITLAAGESLLAVAQRLTRSVLFYQSFYEQQTWFDPATWTRWMGTIDHPLGLSFLICLAIPLLVGLDRAWLQMLLLAVLVSGMLITQSRTGIVIAAAELVFVLAAGKTKPLAKAALVVVSGAGAVLLVASGLASGVTSRITNDAGSAQARGAAFDFVVHNWQHYLIAGAGSGSSYQLAADGGLITSLESAFYIYLVDIGLLFAVVYFGAQAVIVLTAARVRGASGYVVAGVAALIIPQTYSSLGADTSAGVLLWTALGMCCGATALVGTTAAALTADSSSVEAARFDLLHPTTHRALSVAGSGRQSGRSRAAQWSRSVPATSEPAISETAGPAPTGLLSGAGGGRGIAVAPAQPPGTAAAYPPTTARVLVERVANRRPGVDDSPAFQPVTQSMTQSVTQSVVNRWSRGSTAGLLEPQSRWSRMTRTAAGDRRQARRLSPAHLAPDDPSPEEPAGQTPSGPNAANPHAAGPKTAGPNAAGPNAAGASSSAPAPTPPSRNAGRGPGDVAGNMLTTLIGNFFPPLAMLVSAPLLAHALGVDGRGAVAAANAPLVLVTTVATFGVPNAVTYVIARSPWLVQRASRLGSLIVLIAGLLATAVVMLSARWLSGGNPEIRTLILVAALAVIPSLLVAVLRGSASGLHLWRLVTAERMVSAVARLAGLVALVLVHRLTPMSATIVTAVGPILGAVVYLRLARIARQLAVGGGGGSLRIGDVLSYGLRIWVGAISGVLLVKLDQAVMTPLANAHQLGLYAVAATVADIPLIINSAVRDVTFSADAADTTDSRLGASARISSTASAALGLVTGISMIWWLPWLFGHDFSASLGSAAVLIAAAVLGTPGSIAGAGLAARGRPGLRSTSLVVACVVSITLLVLTVPSMGAMGGAIATLAGALLASNANIFFLWKLFDIPPREFYGFRRSDFHAVVRFGRRIVSQLRRTR